MLQLRKLSNQRRFSNDQISGIPLGFLENSNNNNNSNNSNNDENHINNDTNNETSKNNNNYASNDKEFEGNKNQTNLVNVTTNGQITTANQVTLNQNLITNLPTGTQFEDVVNSELNLEWIYKPWIQGIVRICAFLSFLSICANTPETFKKYPIIMIVSYSIDLISTIVLSIEMIAKIKIRGLFRGESAYVFDRWCQFDGIMVIFHIISIVLQVKYQKSLRLIFHLNIY
jgi:hypothetical protein